MKKTIFKKLLFVVIVIMGGLYFTFNKEMKLGLDLKGGVYAVLEATGGKDQVVDGEAMDRLVEVLDRRINGLGVAESLVQKAGNNRIIIELPGVTNPEEAIKMIGKTALMEFRIVKSYDSESGKYILEDEVLLTGSSLKKAAVSSDELGRPQIQFEMVHEGAVKFAEITRNNRGKQLAITLDGEVQTAPTINGEIPGGNGVISGNYTMEEAKAMATLLNAGALPIKAEIVETRTVGASLGEDSIEQSKKAGMLAMALIAIFMLVLYRVPGMVAVIALSIFGLLVFGTLNFIDATLTLPGIAGVILSVGMAVDTNVIIFERIKEEIRGGNTIIGGINLGFKKGFSSIVDSNVTTLIITIILFVFGTGSVKGFAITLTIGVMASMVTAITITKVILLLLVEMFNIKDIGLFGVKRGQKNG